MTKLRLEWLAIAFSLLLFGLFLLLFSTLDGLREDDLALLAGLRELRRPFWNRFFLELTTLGSVTILSWLALSALALLAALRRWGACLQLFFSAVTSTALSFLVKAISARPRPPEEWRLDLVGGYSFPSGHSSSGAAIYLTLLLLLWPALPRGPARLFLTLNLLALVLLIGFSRSYLGVHYPSDVVGGLCLGTGMALLFHALPVLHRRTREARRGLSAS